MTGFVIGVITAMFTYAVVYIDLSLKNKRRFNRWFANGFTDIILTISMLTIGGVTATGLFTALGLGVGISLCLKISKLLYGTSVK